MFGGNLFWTKPPSDSWWNQGSARPRPLLAITTGAPPSSLVGLLSGCYGASPWPILSPLLMAPSCWPEMGTPPQGWSPRGGTLSGTVQPSPSWSTWWWSELMVDHSHRHLCISLSSASKPLSPNVGWSQGFILWPSWPSPPIGGVPPEVLSISGYPNQRILWSRVGSLCIKTRVSTIIHVVSEIHMLHLSDRDSSDQLYFNFNNFVIPYVSHIHKTTTYMDIATICNFPPYKHVVPF